MRRPRPLIARNRTEQKPDINGLRRNQAVALASSKSPRLSPAKESSYHGASTANRCRHRLTCMLPKNIMGLGEMNARKYMFAANQAGTTARYLRAKTGVPAPNYTGRFATGPMKRRGQDRQSVLVSGNTRNQRPSAGYLRQPPHYVRRHNRQRPSPTSAPLSHGAPMERGRVTDRP